MSCEHPRSERQSGVVSSVSRECLQYSSTIRGHQGAIRGNQEVIRGHQGAIRGDHSSAVLLVSDHLRVRAFCDQKVRPVLGAGDPARGDARCALEGDTRSESAGDHLAPLDDVRGISLVELAQSRVRLMTSGNQWQLAAISGAMWSSPCRGRHSRLLEQGASSLPRRGRRRAVPRTRRLLSRGHGRGSPVAQVEGSPSY